MAFGPSTTVSPAATPRMRGWTPSMNSTRSGTGTSKRPAGRSPNGPLPAVSDTSGSLPPARRLRADHERDGGDDHRRGDDRGARDDLVEDEPAERDRHHGVHVRVGGDLGDRRV